jgi:hypothetical protein
MRYNPAIVEDRDERGRTIYRVGSRWFYTREKAERIAGQPAPAARPKLGQVEPERQPPTPQRLPAPPPIAHAKPARKGQKPVAKLVHGKERAEDLERALELFDDIVEVAKTKRLKLTHPLVGEADDVYALLARGRVRGIEAIRTFERILGQLRRLPTPTVVPMRRAYNNPSRALRLRIPMPAGHYARLLLADGKVDIQVISGGRVVRRIRGPWEAARIRASNDSQLHYIVDRAIERGAPRPA